LQSLQQFKSSLGNLKSPFADMELVHAVGIDADAPKMAALVLAEKSLELLEQVINKMKLLVEKVTQQNDDITGLVNTNNIGNTAATVSISELSHLVGALQNMYTKELQVKQRIQQQISFEMDPNVLSTYVNVWEAQPYLDKNISAEVVRWWRLNMQSTESQ